jgi:hypothetical protein
MMSITNLILQPTVAVLICARSETTRPQPAIQVDRAEHTGQDFDQFGKWL